MPSLSPQQRAQARRAAAEAAVDCIRPGMLVGLGTGDTASHAIRALAEKRLPDVLCIATSKATALQAQNCGLSLIDWDHPRLSGPLPIDVTIDGADEVDAAFRLIKGGGGALLFEKIVASASRKMLVIIDPEKQVSRLGERLPLPIEIVPFGFPQTLQKLRHVCPECTLRATPDGQPYQTDGGHFLVDFPLTAFHPSTDWAQWEMSIKRIPGVVETGLFLTHASEVFVGHPDGHFQRLCKAISA